MLVDNIDIGFGKNYDFSDQKVVDRLVMQIRSQSVDGVHSGPPCASWSRVRFKQPGPPPLRTRDFLRGLPAEQLSKKSRAKVALANALLMA